MIKFGSAKKRHYATLTHKRATKLARDGETYGGSFKMGQHQA